MKLSDRYKVDCLLHERSKLADAAMVCSTPIEELRNALGVTIRGVYQKDDLLEEVRPAILAAFERRLEDNSAQLRALGVEPDA